MSDCQGSEPQSPPSSWPDVRFSNRPRRFKGSPRAGATPGLQTCLTEWGARPPEGCDRVRRSCQLRLGQNGALARTASSTMSAAQTALQPKTLGATAIDRRESRPSDTSCYAVIAPQRDPRDQDGHRRPRDRDGSLENRDGSRRGSPSRHHRPRRRPELAQRYFPIHTRYLMLK